MFAFATRPQRFKKLVADGFQLYRQIWIPVIGIAFVMALVGAIPQLHRWAIYSDTTKLLSNPTEFIYLVVQMLLSTYFVSMILLRIYHLAKQNSRENFLTAAKVVWRKLPTLIFGMIVVTVLMLIGLVAFILPGLFVAVLMMFYMPLILFDDKGPWESIKGSCRLVWGNWWKTFFVLAIPLLVIAIVVAISLAVLGEHNLLGHILSELVLMTILMPWFNSAILVQFNELKLIAAKKGA